MKKKPSMTPVYIPSLNAGRCYRNAPIRVPTRDRRVIPGSTPRSIDGARNTGLRSSRWGDPRFCAEERGENYYIGEYQGVDLKMAGTRGICRNLRDALPGRP
jgi:hypothetical protein